MISLDAKKTIEDLRWAILRIENGDSRDAIPLMASALAAVVSHLRGREVVVSYVSDTPRELPWGRT